MSDLLRRAVALAGAALAVGAAPALADAPRILDPAVTKTSAREVVFTANVEPGGPETAVRLEFGATASVGARSETVTVPAGDAPVLVSITLRGQPDTTYFWRFRATNPDGTALTDTARVKTPPDTRRRVMPPVRLSFAIQTEPSGSPLGRIVAFTRPSGLPAGTSLTVRCRRACAGKRTIRIRSRSSTGGLVRFADPVVVRPRTIVEVRAVRDGWVGRVRTYRFRRAGGLLEPLRLTNRCLTPTRPPQRTSCSATA